MNENDVPSPEEYAEVLSRAERAADEVKALAMATRAPSKAHLIGTMRGPSRDSEAGAFLRAVVLAGSRDAEEQATGKAALAGMSRWQAVPEYSKATLGTTDATGGWITPNAIVDRLVKPAGYTNPYLAAGVTVRRGVSSASVDVPWRGSAPNRAVIAEWGSLKENVDLVYGGYSATMYTLARIHDIGKQFARHSAGAAEADAMEELATALARGEAHYLRQGVGTTEPYGLLTALAGMPQYTVAHTATANTLAGQVARAIGACAGALAQRGRTGGIAAVMSGTAYGEMLTTGTDTAGFFLANAVEGAAFTPGTLVSPWGIPVFIDSDLAVDDLIVGQFGALTLYVGENYRVDTTDTAGTRWDYNLIGIRAEEEIGLDARPAVYAGAFAKVEDILS